MSKDKQTKLLKSDDYTNVRGYMSAGSISTDGITVRVEAAPVVKDGRNGKYYSLPVKVLQSDGELVETDIAFSHKGLFEMIIANLELLQKNDAIISGFGTGFDRSYEIKLV
jgi:hypothetical protein